MFAYVKYTDGEKHIVPTDDIKHFKADEINFFKKYKIKWNDEYYEGIILCVGDTKQEVTQKMKKRLRVPPFERCESASESDSTPKPQPRRKVNNDESSAIRSIIDKKVDHVLRDVANEKEKEGSVTENARRMIKPTNKTGAVRKENARKTIPGKEKDNVTTGREVGKSTNRNNPEHKENTVTTVPGKNKKDHVTAGREVGKSTNRNNPEHKENTVTTVPGKNKKDHVTAGREVGKSTNRNNPEHKENTVTTVPGKNKKDHVTAGREVGKSTNRNNPEHKENTVTTVPGKNKKDHVTAGREVGKSTNRNNPEHKENTVTTVPGKNKKDHVTAGREVGKSTNRNNPEHKENTVTTVPGKNKKDHVTAGREVGKSTNRNNPEHKENTVTTVAGKERDDVTDVRETGKSTNKSADSQREERAVTTVTGKQKKDASNVIKSANKNNFQRKENAARTMTKKTVEDVTSERELVKPIHKNNAVRRENAAKENENNPAASTNAGGEKSTREIKLLRDVIDRLKNVIRDKDKANADLLKLNMELQREILNNFEELKLIVGDMQRRIGDRTDTDVGLLPVGYIRRETEMIHLGRDIWISMEQWDTILSICRTPTQFAKQMATTVFGTPVLKNSTVTGIVSNRKKKDKNSAPARPRLDPTKLLAIKDIFLYWLRTVMHLDEVSAEYEASELGTHISHKICDLNRPPGSNKEKKTNASAKAKLASKIAGSRRTDAVENNGLRVCDALLDEEQQDVNEAEQENGNAGDTDDEILFRQCVPSPRLSITDDEQQSPPSTPQENEDAHETNDERQSRPSTPLLGEKIGVHESDDELEFRSCISGEEKENVDKSDDEIQFPPLCREINGDADDADSETQFEGGISAQQLNDQKGDADSETQFEGGMSAHQPNDQESDADSETQFEGGISAHQLNDQQQSDAQLSDDMFSDH